jgi:hypothetical protein
MRCTVMVIEDRPVHRHGKLKRLCQPLASRMWIWAALAASTVQRA